MNKDQFIKFVYVLLMNLECLDMKKHKTNTEVLANNMWTSGEYL